MIKNLLFLFILISPLLLSSQNDCQYDAEGNCIAKGKSKTITHKTSYGGKYVTISRVGLWILFNIDGVKKAVGNYKYDNEFSNKHGEWLFYSDESILLFKRWYVNGMVEKTEFYDTGIYAHESDTILIRADSMGNFKVEERKGKLNYKYITTAKQILSGDPSKYAKIEKAKEAEILSIHQNDEEIIREYPMLNSAIHIKRWAVNNPLNLVNNPDFEAMQAKMQVGHTSQIKMQDETFAKYWASASETPDIFFNNGNCYAGYRVYGVNYEVLRNELKEPLKANVTYCMQFKLKLKYENSFAINGVSVTLSKNIMGFKIPNDAIKNGVVLQTHKDLPLACRDQWMVVSGSFIATGGEKYLYIGNFTPDKDLKLTPVDRDRNSYPDEIYYYIDDVVLVELKEGSLCPCNVNGCELKYDLKDSVEIENIVNNDDDFFKKPAVGKSIVLRNIQFETNKWELLEGSFETLDSLVALMRTYPTMKVEISGYTDNKGNPKSNETLSVNRAFAVVTYLTDLGIEEDRLSYKGMGQKQPIDTNATEEGRFNNRRVEFKILSL